MGTCDEHRCIQKYTGLGHRPGSHHLFTSIADRQVRQRHATAICRRQKTGKIELYLGSHEKIHLQ